MTRPLRSSLFLLLALVLFSTPVRPDPPRNICPLSEVRAGQKAVAKSVFRGTKIESFRVEIIGVLPKFEGTRSVILGRILDGPVVERKSGVIGGMSGSPVYIDGRLAGAIAYAWPWSKEPIAGIQPIEDMLEALPERPIRSHDASAASGIAPAPIRLDGSVIGRVRISPDASAEPDPPGVMTLVPLGGLVQASGFSARGLDRLSDELRPYGLRVQAGAAGAALQLRPPLLPGAALGARLIGGDFDVTTLGTLTMVEGDRVLGFGHPIFQRGDIDLPMTGGYVYDIMPSLLISNKVMSPTQVVGRVYSDQPSAIAGAIGGTADLMPVTIEVEDAERDVSLPFDIEVARLRELTPGLVASSVMTAIDEARGRVARGTARVAIEVEAEGRTLVREDSEYHPMDAAAAALHAVLAPLAVFTENEFRRMDIDRVRVKVCIEERRKTASIERVTVDRSQVEAGDEVTFNVTIRPYGEDPKEIPLKLALPPDLPQGQVRIVVTGGKEADQARNTIGAPKPAPVNLDQLVQRYLSQDASSDLVLQAALPRAGVSLLGEELPGLPRSALDALRATRPTDLRPVPSVAKVAAPTEWVLTGRQSIMLPVASPIPGAGIPKPPPEGPEPPGEPEEEAAAQAVEPLPLVGTSAAPGSIELAAAQPPADKNAAKKDEKRPEALARSPEAWVHNTGPDYQEAKLHNILLTADGSLSLAPVRKDLATLPAAVLWSLAVRDGTAYVGTGSEGKIYRVTAEGDVSEFFATGEMNVHTLAFGADGQMYAGTSPGGKLFSITPEAQSHLVLDSESTYIWSLVVAPDGTIYAGAGSPGRIYAIHTDGSHRLVAELPVANVLSLSLGAEGDLYAGTSDTGVVYRIRADGTATAIGQLPGASVDSLLLDESGNLFASSSPGGQIYRIPPAGAPALYLETGQQTIFGIALLPGEEGKLVAATGPRGLVILGGADKRPDLIFRPDSGVATAVTTAEGAIYVASSAPAELRAFGPQLAESGVVESPSLDAERPARWGRVTYACDTPEGTTVSADTRSGDSPIPGEGWSPWTPTLDGNIASPPARYLQYRLSLRTEAPDASPLVRQVAVSRRPKNRPPTIAIRTPEPGARLSKELTLKWQGRDPDRDKLTYDIEVSPNLGASWEDVGKNVRETKYDWDTSEQKDGRYLLRITASDRLSAPDDPETVDASEVIWLDNTPPVLLLFRSSLSVDDERRAAVTGMATDELSPLRSVEYRIGDGEWESAPLSAVEGSLTSVEIRTDPLDGGEHTLEVRAFDSAGNLSSDSVEVTIEAPEGEEAPEAGPAEQPEAPAESVAPEAPAEAEAADDEAEVEGEDESAEPEETEAPEEADEAEPDNEKADGLEAVSELRGRLADELFGFPISAGGSHFAVIETAFGTGPHSDRCSRASAAEFRNGF